MGETKVDTTKVRTRVLCIVIDGKVRVEPARERTMLEVQHELRLTGKTVRVTERYV